MPYTLALPIGPVEAFVLIATRVLAVLATSPVLSIKNVPNQAKLGLGLFTALILVPVIGKDGPPPGVDVTWTALAGEALVGALSGFAATLAYTAISFGASLLDLQAGFSMGALYDQTFGTQGAVLERFYSGIAALLFFQTDAHYLVIQALAQLFQVVPLGTFSLSKINPELLAQIAASSFVLAIELIFPVLVALMLAEMALGVLAKVAPQFGIFQIGLQVKVGLALGAIALTMPLLLPRLHALFNGMVGVSIAVLR
ncbi:MAG: flagellar biosynthetic protein FliR [Chloroflexi bacterium]|nr:flagellar biosynthetic protein FliR [Chloroflexota bacterium]MBV9132561.1 flagellar biosynthetic protein FliR [Chloroflexota bacterium]MBV9895264.1 flagellar biosynthetic protein FliR [Chloroflexota bacterium]